MKYKEVKASFFYVKTPNKTIIFSKFVGLKISNNK